MIEQIKLLRNVGQFDNVSLTQDMSFKPFSLVYGENGRGKTTLAAILRSLAINDPILVEERQRLGSQQQPHIVIKHADGLSEFQQGAWKQHLNNLVIFGDAFVTENVCSGIEIQPTHRRKLHELILGTEGITLNNTLQEYVLRIEKHNTTLRNLANAVPTDACGPYNVDSFCNIIPEDNITVRVQNAERRLAAAHSAEAIQVRPDFEDFTLPYFDIEAIDAVLGRSLPDLEAEASQRVKTHLGKLGKGGETWVSKGMPFIQSLSTKVEGEICPFCAQNLNGLQLIKHYRSYFSKAYQDLKNVIIDTGILIRDTHSGEIQSSFERYIRTTIQTHEFWKDFTELPQIDIDTEDIVKKWSRTRDAVLAQLRLKVKMPLEPMKLTSDTCQAINDYHRGVNEVEELSELLIEANDQIEIVKEQVQGDDITPLEENLAVLRAKKARFSPTVVSYCDDYINEKKSKTITENLRNQTRTELDNYRNLIFPAYEKSINDYLQRFGASFSLGKVQSFNSRTGSSASYYVVINHQNVKISAEKGPSFRNTLSSGDRNTLALAFFFASLEKDPNLANKIVVIDDPITSLDEHRTRLTCDEILNMSQRVKQVIVLSHSKPFLCSLWKRTGRNNSMALRISRSGASSKIILWDVWKDNLSEHDKRHELVRSYVYEANPEKEREVAASLRLILEAFIRVAYSEYFPPGSLLGPFVEKCRQRLGGCQEILSDDDVTILQSLVNYANLFHHDTNPAWQSVVINDTELVNFAERTLLFTSRR